MISKFLEGLAFSAMHGNGAYLSGLGNFFCTGFAIMSQNSGKGGKSKAEVDRCTLTRPIKHEIYLYRLLDTNLDTNTDTNTEKTTDTNT